MTAAAAYSNGGGQRGALAADLGDMVLPNPLDHIAEEHLRLREICGRLDELVAAVPQPDRARAAEVLAHLKVALPRHVQDEEDDLFPLLRRRSEGDEDISDTLDRLIADHGEGRTAVARVCAALERSVTSDTAFTPEEAAAVAAFAARERRHLIVENAIVLPLARVRLTSRDLTKLRRRMMRRRVPAIGEERTHAE